MDEPQRSEHELNARLLRFRSKPEAEEPRLLAEALLAAERYGDARGVAVEAQPPGQPQSELLVLEGRAWMAEGELTRALDRFLSAVGLTPEDPEPYRWLGQALMLRGDPLRAQRALEQSLELSPDCEQTQDRLAKVRAAVERARERLLEDAERMGSPPGGGFGSTPLSSFFAPDDPRVGPLLEAREEIDPEVEESGAQPTVFVAEEDLANDSESDLASVEVEGAVIEACEGEVVNAVGDAAMLAEVSEPVAIATIEGRADDTEPEIDLEGLHAVGGDAWLSPDEDEALAAAGLVAEPEVESGVALAAEAGRRIELPPPPPWFATSAASTTEAGMLEAAFPLRTSDDGDVEPDATTKNYPVPIDEVEWEDEVELTDMGVDAWAKTQSGAEPTHPGVDAGGPSQAQEFGAGDAAILAALSGGLGAATAAIGKQTPAGSSSVAATVSTDMPSAPNFPDLAVGSELAAERSTPWELDPDITPVDLTFGQTAIDPVDDLPDLPSFSRPLPFSRQAPLADEPPEDEDITVRTALADITGNLESSLGEVAVEEVDLGVEHAFAEHQEGHADAPSAASAALAQPPVLEACFADDDELLASELEGEADDRGAAFDDSAIEEAWMMDADDDGSRSMPAPSHAEPSDDNPGEDGVGDGMWADPLAATLAHDLPPDGVFDSLRPGQSPFPEVRWDGPVAGAFSETKSQMPLARPAPVAAPAGVEVSHLVSADGSQGPARRETVLEYARSSHAVEAGGVDSAADPHPGVGLDEAPQLDEEALPGEPVETDVDAEEDSSQPALVQALQEPAMLSLNPVEASAYASRGHVGRGGSSRLWWSAAAVVLIGVGGAYGYYVNRGGPGAGDGPGVWALARRTLTGSRPKVGSERIAEPARAAAAAMPAGPESDTPKVTMRAPEVGRVPPKGSPAAEGPVAAPGQGAAARAEGGQEAVVVTRPDGPPAPRPAYEPAAVLDAALVAQDLAAAEAVWNELNSEQKNSESGRQVEARLRLQQGREDRALKVLDPLRGNPTSSTLALIGEALYAKGHVNGAAVQYDSALALDGDHVGALLGRAEVHLRAGHPFEALPMLEHAAHQLRSDESPEASLYRVRRLSLLGHAYLQREQDGDRERAQAVLSKAVSMPFVPPEAYFWLGESLGGRRTTEAASAYRAYLERAPEGRYAHRALRALGPL